MSSGRATLHRCLGLLFPEIPDGEIRNVSVETVPEWDSLTTITLVALLEEEFDIEIDGDEIANLTSYDRVCEFLAKMNRLTV